MPNRILVIGATGMLGEPVARQLQANGHQVRVFTRHAEAAQARFGAEYQVLAGLSRNKAMQTALPFFRYTEQVAEAGDPTEANVLLGAPATTMEQWSRLSVNGVKP